MKTRIISKLEIKPPYVVKPIHFDGLEKKGLAYDLAQTYYNQGADEIFYIDVVASLYRRPIILEEVLNVSKTLFVPFCVGGGVKSLDDFSSLFLNGADKVVINTHALQSNPKLINEASQVFGRQSVVVNIEAKKNNESYECYTDGGRIKSGRKVLDWAKEAEDRGAGEILIQAIDKDGRQNGFDIDLISELVASISIPVIAASGAGTFDHIKTLLQHAKPSGVAISSALHNKLFTIEELKIYLNQNGFEASA
jgi:cyclase